MIQNCIFLDLMEAKSYITSSKSILFVILFSNCSITELVNLFWDIVDRMYVLISILIY